MSEWKETTLGQCSVSIQTGPFGSQLHQSDYTSVGIPVIMPKDIIEGRIRSEDIAFISKKMADELSRHRVAKFDIIYPRRGDIAKCALVKQDQTGWICGTGCVKVTPDQSKVDPTFLSYCLKFNPTIEWLTKNAVGTTMLNLNTEILSSLPLRLPTLKSQKIIGRILSSLDDKIETYRAINARLEELASAIFKSWFIDFEPFADGEFVEDEYGRRPKGWKVGSLSDISSIVMGQSPEGASLNTESGTLFYQGCSEFGTRFPSVKKFTTSPLRYAEPFSVLLSVRAPVGALNVAHQKCCIGRGLASINSQYKSFVLYTLKNYQSALDRYNGEGTVFGCIKKSDVENIPVLLPPNGILERFEKVVQPIDGIIFNKFCQEQNLASLRDTLLPRLMSGELIPE